MSSAQSRFRLQWHTVIVAVLTVGLVWWFVRSLDFASVWDAIKSANPGLIVLTVLVTFQTYVIRTWRWQALLQPIGHARFRSAFRTTVIGFTATFVLPGRIGEVLRPYLLARTEGFNTAATFATIIVERVLDMASVVLLFALFLVTTSVDVGREVKLIGAFAAVATFVGLGLMAISAGHPERIGGWAGRAASVLPARMAQAAARLVHTFVEGLAVMRRPATVIWAFGLSILLWLSIALGVWLVSSALDVTFSFSGSFLVLVFLVLGVAVPTPAGVGSFHWAYEYAVTTFFYAQIDHAKAAAIVLHAASFVPISIVGLIFMAQDGLTFRSMKGIQA